MVGLCFTSLVALFPRGLDNGVRWPLSELGYVGLEDGL